jgi:hypothetical protein
MTDPPWRDLEGSRSAIFCMLSSALRLELIRKERIDRLVESNGGGFDHVENHEASSGYDVLRHCRHQPHIVS